MECECKRENVSDMADILPTAFANVNIALSITLMGVALGMTLKVLLVFEKQDKVSCGNTMY